jgi:glycosyltransferase involved in cell wall biosynthesis
VVVPTRDRAELLAGALDSLEHQTVGREAFQVVVVDDGSTDATADLCRARAADAPSFTYRRLTHGGLGLAKNVGILAARAPIVVFLDDDDLFDPDLLATHLRVHRAHPAEHVAVLGHTDWAPHLSVSPLMRYLTDVGQLLFSYPSIPRDEPLDYTRFWGGRSSCKRAFLLRHGIFDPRFTSIIEDVELGFRLSRHGLVVRYEHEARSHAARGVGFADFCARCERRGRALALLHHLHPEPEIADYCGAATARDRLEQLGPHLDEVERRVRELEDRGEDPDAVAELHDLYGRAFATHEAAGFVAAQEELSRPRPGSAAG